jgi:hypothetical protein
MITKFTRKFWETCVQYKGTDKIVLRDYDMMKLHERGKSLQQIATKYGLTKRGVIKALAKYKR